MDMLYKECSLLAAKCVFVLRTSVSCEESASTPVIVSSSAGAFATSMQCKSDSSVAKIGKARYELEGFSDFEKSLLGSGGIGIAAPLVDGDFVSVRFKLDGAKAASEKAAIEFILRMTKRDKGSKTERF